MRKIQLIGYVGQDAVINEAANKKVINFNLGVQEKYKDKDNVDVSKTIWFNCAIWKDKEQSTSIAQYIKKGQQVFVEGSPDASVFTPQGSTEPQGKIKVKVSNILLLGTAPVAQKTEPSANPQEPQMPQP